MAWSNKITMEVFCIVSTELEQDTTNGTTVLCCSYRAWDMFVTIIVQRAYTTHTCMLYHFSLGVCPKISRIRSKV